MTVLKDTADPATLTLTFVAEFDAAPEEVWQVWEDPRKLERWWGPPTYPAAFTRHEFVEGGECRYHMTGPEGDQHHAWWRIESIGKPHTLELTDGFAGDDGEPLPGDEPVTMRVTFEPTDGGTRMTTVTHFASTEQLEKMLEMGMQEGMRLAMGQIDAVLASAA